MNASRTRAYACELYRHYQQNPEGFQQDFSDIRDALTWAIDFIGDDRPLSSDSQYLDRLLDLGKGNRWKRRAGWKLTKWYCHHMDGGYDCCCEPQSGYYYQEPWWR